MPLSQSWIDTIENAMTQRVFTCVALLFIFAHSVSAKTPLAPAFSRPQLYALLQRNDLVNSSRHLISYYHACDLLIEGNRLPVVYLAETTSAPKNQPQKMVRTTVILTTGFGVATRIDGQVSAPLSCVDQFLIFPEDLIGLPVTGRGSILEFGGLILENGAVSVEPLRLVSKLPLPAKR